MKVCEQENTRLSLNVQYYLGYNSKTVKLKQLLDVCGMICKQTITRCMWHDM